MGRKGGPQQLPLILLLTLRSRRMRKSENDVLSFLSTWKTTCVVVGCRVMTHIINPSFVCSNSLPNSNLLKEDPFKLNCPAWNSHKVTQNCGFRTSSRNTKSLSKLSTLELQLSWQVKVHDPYSSVILTTPASIPSILLGKTCQLVKDLINFNPT